MGIAKVIIRTREHLAAVNTQGEAVILEIMHFGDELVDASDLKFPKKSLAREREVALAAKLIDGMTAKWEPEKYEDDYKNQIMKMIEEKMKHPKRKPAAPSSPKKPSNVIDLMSVLQQSLSHSKAPKGKNRRRRNPKRPRRTARPRSRPTPWLPRGASPSLSRCWRRRRKRLPREATGCTK